MILEPGAQIGPARDPADPGGTPAGNKINAFLMKIQLKINDFGAGWMANDGPVA